MGADDIVEQFFFESQYSRLYEEYPDTKLYPKYYEAKKYEVILEEGEMLHIPAGWFHWVFSEKTGKEGLNIAVNYWYKADWDFGHFCTHNFFKFKYNQNIEYMKLLFDTKHYLLLTKSPTRYFPEQRIRHHFPHIPCTDLFMTFKEFYEDPSDDLYISSLNDPRLIHYSPPWCNNSNLSYGGSGRWWINKGNVTTGLHYDSSDNWLYQLSGTKRIVLFSPNDHEKLYLINHYNHFFLKRVQTLLDKDGRKPC
jgi:Cupin-like domain